MEFLQSNLTFIIATGTLVTNILFVVFIISLFAMKDWRNKVYSFVDKNVLHLIFSVSFLAMAGSLAYSNIMNFPPCELCWIQRIFMFPQPIIAFLAMWRNDKKIVDYLLPLTVIGTLIALYQSMANWGFGAGLLECTAVGGECSKVYVLEYGYITIPFMALSSFVYLLTISVIYYKARNAEK